MRCFLGIATNPSAVLSDIIRSLLAFNIKDKFARFTFDSSTQARSNLYYDTDDIPILLTERSLARLLHLRGMEQKVIVAAGLTSMVVGAAVGGPAVKPTYVLRVGTQQQVNTCPNPACVFVGPGAANTHIVAWRIAQCINIWDPAVVWSPVTVDGNFIKPEVEEGRIDPFNKKLKLYEQWGVINSRYTLVVK